MGDFSQIRQALESGIIDAYVSERPEGRTAEAQIKLSKWLNWQTVLKPMPKT